jgi:uncharacterized protein (TIGR02147 family)
MTHKQPNIFEYLDYRDYLKDFCAYRKARTQSFSQRNFARAAGIPEESSSILAAVIRGKRNLSRNYRLKFVFAMKLKERESQYFEHLVRFNQAKTMEEKNFFFSQISKFRNSRAALIRGGQIKLYSKWYYVVVWNYIGTKKGSKDPNSIAREVYPPITVAQAKEAIDLLLDLKLIRKTAGGYAVTHGHVKTEKEVRGMATMQYMQELMHMAAQNFTHVPQDARQYSGVVFSVSKDGFDTIKERIGAFKEELKEIVERDGDEDRVYTLTMQLYPNTKVF